MTAMFSKASGAFSGAFSHEDKDKVAKADEEGESLTTILSTAEDRSALTILVADCTEVMRQSIVDIFDAKQTGKPADLVADLSGDQTLVDTTANPDTVDVAEQDKLKREMAQREKELSGPQMQELKTAALDYFDKWRESVIQRVGEIVNSKQTAHAHKEHAKPEVKSADHATTNPNTSQYDPGVAETMHALYPPIANNLSALPEPKKALILHSCLLLLLSLEHYQAPSRTLLLHLTTSLQLPISLLADDESKIARGLLTAAENMQAESSTQKKAEENQDSRKWKVGLATVAGAALIGVTGGLAAPLLAAGVGSMMGGLGLGATAAAGYLGTVAGSTVIVGGLFGAYGGKMTGKMMDQYAREVEDFAFIPIRGSSAPKHHHHIPHHGAADSEANAKEKDKDTRRLRVSIGISGWLNSPSDVSSPWLVLGSGMEAFALRWELEALMNLGNSMTTMIKSAAWGYAKKEIIRHTVFAALTAGLWPLGLLKVSRIIDNPWSVANYRAALCGEVLADALMNKAQGERPVTLVGYSLGAKVIFVCLQRLAERKAFGLVENAILIGAPTPSTAADWRMLRSVVSGRVVNVFSTQDYILGFLYRSSSVQYGVAGLQAVQNVKGVENFDVSDLVTGHTAYRLLTGTILRKIGFEDVDAVEFDREEKALRAEEAKAKAERKDEEVPTEQLAGTKLEGSDDQQLREMEKEVKRRNEQSYVGWAQQQMVGAGTSAGVAYQKALAQWNLKSQAPKAPTADEGLGKAESYESMKARRDARKAEAVGGGAEKEGLTAGAPSLI
ncbi:hypothetical protein LTR08_000887 [Meristemomyces frigidus]|nr:hypothetical protein LTR08_000887 [Meristemomyces frigidus]